MRTSTQLSDHVCGCTGFVLIESVFAANEKVRGGALEKEAWRRSRSLTADDHDGPDGGADG